MTTPTPRADLKRILAGLASIPLPYATWKGEQEPNIIPPGNYSPTFAVLGASNATPIAITVASTTGLYDGLRVVASGIGGNTNANGPWSIDSTTQPTGTTFNLTGSLGNSAWTSGGTIALENPFRWAQLRIKASKRDAVGWDDLHQTDNVDGTITMASKGRRVILLSVDCMSFDPTAEVMADDILEDVRTKIWHPEILDALNGVGLVAQDVGTIVDLPTQRAGRIISAAHLDITLALAVTDLARYPAVTRGWVQEVTGSGVVTEEDGTSTITIPFDVNV